jgi:chitinase
VVLAFLTTFFGPGDLPVLNFASHCSQTFPGSNLLKCDEIAKDIKTCQDKGILVLLSLGGAIADVGFTGDAQASAFGDQLWNLFGAGQSDTRPFGDAVLDGFDLDIENGSPKYFISMVKQLQRRFKQSDRTFYMAAAPQCPFPDAMLGDVLNEAPFDMVFVQHYNNPSCAIANKAGFNGATWQDWAKTSPNPRVKLFLGVPAAPAAAGSGYVDAATVGDAVQQTKSQYGSARLGGVMMWDASFLSLPNTNNFAKSVKAVLRGAASDAGTQVKEQVAYPQATTSAVQEPPSPAVPAQATTFVYVAGIGPGPSPAAKSSKEIVVDDACAECTIEGKMECRPDGSFATCDHGAWVIRACAPGTQCKTFGDSILCDFASSNSAKRRVKRAGLRLPLHEHEHEHVI